MKRVACCQKNTILEGEGELFSSLLPADRLEVSVGIKKNKILYYRTEQLRKLGRFITTTQTSLTIWSLYTPPAWVQNSVAVGTADRGLSPSRMSFLGIGQPTPGGAKHMHLMICTLTMPFPFHLFLVRCAVPNPVLGLGDGTPPSPPVWQGSNTPAACHLSLPAL